MQPPSPPLRILVVNDSRTARATLRRALAEEDPSIDVVAEVEDGERAVDAVDQLHPDLVLMDVVMPRMDGYAAARAIMGRRPTPIVLISSVVATRDVKVALESLRSGALWITDALPTPTDPTYPARRGALVQLLRAMANVRVGLGDVRPSGPGIPEVHEQGKTAAIGIAASTGGPQALDEILRAVPPRTLPPVLLVQHIAHGFTEGFASWLSSATGHRVVVAAEGMPAEAGAIYVAPEDLQLGIDRDLSLRVRSEPPVGVFRPSATHLFRSLARSFGASAAGLVLTGMGSDGAAGLLAIRRAGGATAAQDESTSVIYGMPRAAIAAGAVESILPLPAVAGWLVRRSGS